jgi:hypothetical protein
VTEAEDDPNDLVVRGSETLNDAMSAEVGRFMGTVLGSASVEFDRMLGDRVKWWRFRQSVRLAKKAKAFCDAEGLSPEQVPLRIAVPLLERGSLAEEPELSDRFAALLANAATQTVAVSASYSQVLAELEPRAALLLDSIYDRDMRIAPEFRAAFSVRTEDEREGLGLTREEYEAHLDDLARLGLVRSTPGTPRELDDDVYRYVSLTAFGRGFVAACKPPNTPPPPIEWTDPEALERRAVESESVTLALERLAYALGKAASIRKALVRYVVSEGRVDELCEITRDIPHGIPLRNVARYLAEFECYTDAMTVAMEITNLQERTKLAIAVMKDFAEVGKSSQQPMPEPMHQLLTEIYASSRLPQRTQLERSSARLDLTIAWPTAAPEP